MFQTLLDPQNIEQLNGISISTKPFLEIATELAHHGPLFLLHENSKLFRNYLDKLSSRKANVNTFTFILSDHIDLNEEEHAFLVKELKATQVSLGFTSYLASHCIIFVLMELKKYGFLNDIE